MSLTIKRLDPVPGTKLPADAQWKNALRHWFGKAQAATILKRRVCQVCQGRVRQFRMSRHREISTEWRCMECGRVSL